MTPPSQGYYAIDDIDIRDSYCGTTPITASVEILTTPATVTRPTTAFQSLFILDKNYKRNKIFFFNIVPSIYDCTFEVDFCSWTHRADAKLQWLRNQGSTSTAETGPQFDVTTQSGYL